MRLRSPKELLVQYLPSTKRDLHYTPSHLHPPTTATATKKMQFPSLTTLLVLLTSVATTGTLALPLAAPVTPGLPFGTNPIPPIALPNIIEGARRIPGALRRFTRPIRSPWNEDVLPRPRELVRPVRKPLSERVSRFVDRFLPGREGR